MKRLAILLWTALAVFVMASSLVPRATAQDVAQELNQYQGPVQVLSIPYPQDGVILSGQGDDAIKYKGLIYVEIYPVSVRLKKKFGDGPVLRKEIYPNGTINAPTGFSVNLPIGEYEVHFSMREGDAMRTCIKRGVLLTSNSSVNAEVEMSGTTRTLVIGGDDMTAQQMHDSLLQLKQQVAALQAEVAALKGGKAAATFPK